MCNLSIREIWRLGEFPFFNGNECLYELIYAEYRSSFGSSYRPFSNGYLTKRPLYNIFVLRLFCRLLFPSASRMNVRTCSSRLKNNVVSLQCQKWNLFLSWSGRVPVFLFPFKNGKLRLLSHEAAGKRDAVSPAPSITFSPPVICCRG